MKILVIGDAMLDEYISGNVSRVSPEAPVPIVGVSKRKSTLGGAANVAMNIQSLGIKADLASVIGNDAEGKIFLQKLENNGINFNGIESEKRITTVKTRIIGNDRQIARYDKEQIDELDINLEDEFIYKCKNVIKNYNMVIISDYKKGVCTEKVCQEIIKTAKEFGLRVIIDPKQNNWQRYRGAYLIKPNFKEFSETGKTVENLLSDYELQNILITRSHDGMTLANKNETKDFKSEAKDVYDVSGAGDTVIGTIAAFLAKGMELNEAVRISNIAAGIAVGKMGVYTVTLSDIENVIYNKLISRTNLANQIDAWRKQNKKIVFTNGCFDIIHAGHISLLKQAKQFGDILIVGLNSDASVKSIKGETRPVNNETDRADVLSAIEFVDAITIFNEDTPFELIKEILPDVLVKGADYTPQTVVGADIVIANGGKIEFAKLVEGKSSSKTIAILAKEI
ncbi:MAG: D-glycero-beta-D-manno-heptose 1-phosphate adenylyltransferase [Fibromonadales bacterium]|nr:D-glycero-beta-D-manno-heptose 1-phosphate adenylyltransferase [Fibromonadales bacterium]